MTLHDYRRMRTYWRGHPPAHVALAAGAGGGYRLEPPKTIEQQWAEGAMGPEDFHLFTQATGGKLPGSKLH